MGLGSVLSLRPPSRSLATLGLWFRRCGAKTGPEATGLRVKPGVTEEAVLGLSCRYESNPEGRDGGSLVVSGLDLGLVFPTCLIYLIFALLLCCPAAFVLLILPCIVSLAVSCRFCLSYLFLFYPALFLFRLTFSFSMPAAGGR